ncbi:MAG: sulfatase-like hydrolase/transferase [Bacteroidales bacterium]
MQKLKYITDRIRLFLSRQRNIFAIFMVLLMLPNCFLMFTDNMTMAMRVAYLFIPIGVYMILLSLRCRPGVVMFFLFGIILLSCVQYVIIFLFGNSIIASDMFLNLFIGNSGEANELLSSLLPFIILGVLVLVGTLWVAIHSITIEDKFSNMERRRALIIAACALFIGLVSAGIQRFKYEDRDVLMNIYPVNVFYNIKFAHASWQKNQAYYETSKNFKFGAEATHNIKKREVYILVIGETSRADSWSLYGYERQTNPRLSEVDSLIVFTDATTVSNTTFKSVPLILTAVSPEDFDDLYLQKSIVTAFKESGFKTAFFSNQSPSNSFIDYYMAEADTSLFMNSNPESSDNHHFDHELLPYVSQQIEHGNENLFIILHIYGSHFNYAERYEERFRKFTPDEVTGLDYMQRENLINAYDNSILVVDDLLAELIGKLKSSGVVGGLFYLSDHGEDLMDDKYKRSLHSSPSPSYYQLHIPMVMWFTNQYNRNFPDKVKLAKRHSNAPVSTVEVFHTVVDMAGIKTKYLDSNYSMVNCGFEVSERFFLDDHNMPIPLDECGMKPEDGDMFLKMGLQYP